MGSALSVVVASDKNSRHFKKNGRRRLRRSACSRMEHVSALVEDPQDGSILIFFSYLPQPTKLDTLQPIRTDQHKKRVSHEEKYRKQESKNPK